MTGKQNGKFQKAKFRSNRSSAESPQKEDVFTKSPDLSILRKPIQTSVTGFVQARDVFDTGTEEIKELLSTECDVIYECRVCRNLFRSLANFISHKRIYCRQKFNTSLHAHFINTVYSKDDLSMILQSEQDYQDFLKNKEYTQEIVEAEKQSLKKPFTKDLTSIIERLTLSKADEGRSNNSAMCLQPTSKTKQAVYQSIVGIKSRDDSIMKQLNEIQKLESLEEAVLGPDGKVLREGFPVISISDEEDNDECSHNIVCRICKLKFSTQKTLRFHLKYKHAENKLVYPCPECVETFANAWGVYRHLFKVHRKSAAYIRKLRESIHNKAFKLQRKLKKVGKSSKINEEMEAVSEQSRLDLEDQEWMDNLEADCEGPRCGGCGRKFERRAALSSHRQTCQLRIAAQNKITSNMQKRQAAKVVSKDVPLPVLQIKLESDKVEMSPAKIARIESKPIEIQIRRDYNKGPIGSPKRVVTPVTGGESNGSVSEGGEVNKKGMKCDSIINVRPNIINEPYIETVKDCDDADVVSDLSTPSESIRLSPAFSDRVVESDDTSAEIDEDDELSFEDIRRICQGSKHIIPVESPGSEPNIKIPLENAVSEKRPKESTKQLVSEKVKFKCKICKNEVKSQEELDNHEKVLHQVTMYQCKFCNFKSAEKSDSVSHVKVKHKMLGDDGRIEKFVKAISVPLVDLPDIKETIVMPTTASQSSVENSPEKATSQESSAESSPNKESSLSVTSNCSDMESESGSRKKRGRPPKDERFLSKKYRMYKMKQLEVQLPVKGSKSVSVNIKKAKKISKSGHSAAPHTTIKIEDIYSSPDLNARQIILSNTYQPRTKIKLRKMKKLASDTQHSASSLSSTVNRPIRNRVRVINKDFEYDMKKILNMTFEEDSNKDVPQLSPVLQKPPLKRKSLLQNENQSSDQLTEAGEPKARVKQDRVAKQELEKVPKREAEKKTKQGVVKVGKREIEKPYMGALHLLSLKAAEKVKAHMKHMSPVMRKELPAFIPKKPRSILISSSGVILSQNTPKSEVQAPPKMKAERSAIQQQITPSMIYEKLSLDNSGSEDTSIDSNMKEPSSKLGRKNFILANMSKVFSKTVKPTQKSKADKVMKQYSNDDQSANLSSLKRDNDLPCPVRLSKRSASQNDVKSQNNRSLLLLPTSLSSSPITTKEKNKPNKSDIDDETSEFVLSEKLTSVNILRRQKPAIHLKSSNSTVDPQTQSNIMLTLTSKVYKRKLPESDAVAIVDVSDKSKNIVSVTDNIESPSNSVCDDSTNIKSETPEQ